MYHPFHTFNWQSKPNVTYRVILSIIAYFPLCWSINLGTENKRNRRNIEIVNVFLLQCKHQLPHDSNVTSYYQVYDKLLVISDWQNGHLWSMRVKKSTLHLWTIHFSMWQQSRSACILCIYLTVNSIFQSLHSL